MVCIGFVILVVGSFNFVECECVYVEVVWSVGLDVVVECVEWMDYEGGMFVVFLLFLL